MRRDEAGYIRPMPDAREWANDEHLLDGKPESDGMGHGRGLLFRYCYSCQRIRPKDGPRANDSRFYCAACIQGEEVGG